MDKGTVEVTRWLRLVPQYTSSGVLSNLAEELK